MISPVWLKHEAQFLPSSDRVDTDLRTHYMDANLTYGEKVWRQLHKNAASNIEQVPEVAPNKTYGHLLPVTKTIKIRRTRHAGHCWRSSDELISDVLLWTPSHGRGKQDVQLKPTYSSSVPIRYVALRIFQKQWIIGRCGERESGISVLIALHDDEDDDDCCVLVSEHK